MNKLVYFTPLLLFSSTTHAVQTATSKSLQDFLANPENSKAMLTHYRSRRENRGWFEETQAGNHERECVEEKCSLEELSEIIEDEDARDRAWKVLVNNCQVTPLCSGEGTHICVQTWNAKQCVCKKGYTGSFCEIDVDECLANENGEEPCGENQVCVNKIGSFKCQCENGYESVSGLDTDESLTCVDIDECQQENICDSGVCQNLPGSFDCVEDDGPGSRTFDDDDFSGSGTEEPVTEEVPVTEETTTEFLPTTTKAATTEVLTTESTTTEKIYAPVDNCESANLCKYNNGKGGCDHVCEPVCFGECDCSYKCSCNPGFVLSCDMKSCVPSN